MTNPNNAIGTNGAYGGRTSVNAMNDVLSQFTDRGVLSGWKVSPSSGLTVSVGGSGSERDVAIAMDNAGNFTTVNNISHSPVSVTMPAAPGVNKRIDAIVVYVKNPPQGSSTKVDNYEACGIITASGTVASSPSNPTEAQIRSAITADGASGSTAYYAVLAYITLETGTTDIDAAMIKDGSAPTVNLPDGSITSDKIDWSTISSMTISLTSDVSDSSAESDIALNTTKDSSGTKLTRSSGDILIGAGVSKVVVSANAFCSRAAGASSNYCWFSVVKIHNGTPTEEANAIAYFGSYYGSCSITPFVLSVQQGDKISLKCKEAHATIRSGTNTWLTAVALG